MDKLEESNKVLYDKNMILIIKIIFYRNFRSE